TRRAARRAGTRACDPPIRVRMQQTRHASQNAMSHPVTRLTKDDVDPIPAKIVPFVRKVMKWSSRFNVWIYEKTNGKLGGRFALFGPRVCLVSYTGRKSGRRLTTPLIHIPYEGGILLVASQGGLETNPLWYENMLANPAIEVNELGKVRAMRARRATAEEKLA